MIDENFFEGCKVRLTLSYGAVVVLNEAAIRLRMDKILGRDKRGSLALWLAMAYLINSSCPWSDKRFTVSKALKLAPKHAVHHFLDLREISEEELEKTLDWLLLKKEELEEEFGLKTKREDLFDRRLDVVIMLAKVLMNYLKKNLNCIDRTVRDFIYHLHNFLNVVEITKGSETVRSMSSVHDHTQEKLDLLGIEMPSSISYRVCKVKRDGVLLDTSQLDDEE